MLISVLALALAVAPGASRPSEPRFERVGLDQGFPVQAITDLEVDRTGFLWIGSREEHSQRGRMAAER